MYHMAVNIANKPTGATQFVGGHLSSSLYQQKDTYTTPVVLKTAKATK